MERLQKAFDALRPTEAQEEKMLREILIARDDAPRRRRRGGNPVRVAALIAAALALCVVTASAAEALGVSQIIRDYFQQKEETSIMDTLNVAASGLTTTTEDGWKITVTDLFGDPYRCYLGVTLEASEEVVLDRSDYKLIVDSIDSDFYGLDLEDEQYEDESIRNGWFTMNQIDDGNPRDNKISFVGYQDISNYQDGLSIDLIFEQLYWYDRSVSKGQNGINTVSEFNISIRNIATHFSANGFSVEPNVKVKAYGGETTLTEMRISPLTLSVQCEGGSAFHSDVGDIDCGPTRPERFVSWCKLRGVPADEIDSEIVHTWNRVCHYDVPIVIYYKDGTSLELDVENMSHTPATNCDSKNGISMITYKFGSLLDLDTVDYITVCDVRVPLTGAK